MKRSAVLLIFLSLQASFLRQSTTKVLRRPLKVAAAVAPAWPKGKMAVGKQQVQIIVTTDGYFGNVIAAESKEPSSIFSEVSEAAARLWKFYPAKPNSKQTLTFVFEVFPKQTSTQTTTTFIPPYEILVQRGEDE